MKLTDVDDFRYPDNTNLSITVSRQGSWVYIPDYGISVISAAGV